MRTAVPTAADDASSRGTSPEHAGWRLAAWGLVAAGVALVHNRLWASPNLTLFAQISHEWGRSPFTGAETPADYLLTNLSMPTLARVLGQTSPNEYARLHLIVLVVGVGLCVWLMHRRFGYAAARTLVVVCAAAPGVTVVMQWLGQPDALLFPIGLALALIRPRWALLALAALAGLTHPEQSALMVLVAVVARVAIAPRPALRVAVEDLVTVVVGVGIARGLVQTYLWLADIQITSPRTHYVDLGADVFWRHHTQQPWQLVYLLWGPLWLVIGAVVVVRWRRRGTAEPHVTRSWVLLGAMAVLAVVPVLVTLDETRVYAMLTAPLVAAAAVLIAREWAPVALLRASVALLVIAVIVPGGFTAGIASWAPDFPLGEFVPFLWSGTHPGDLDTWVMSPFHFIIPI